VQHLVDHVPEPRHEPCRCSRSAAFKYAMGRTESGAEQFTNGFAFSYGESDDMGHKTVVRTDPVSSMRWQELRRSVAQHHGRWCHIHRQIRRCVEYVAILIEGYCIVLELCLVSEIQIVRSRSLDQ
jgi:hypothetical protein